MLISPNSSLRPFISRTVPVLALIFSSALLADVPARPSVTLELAGAGQSRLSFADAVKSAAPSTVTIVTGRPLSESKQRVWDRMNDQQRKALIQEQEVIKIGSNWLEPVGHGSGFIVDDKGSIVTNNHVVAVIDSHPEVTFGVSVGRENLWRPATIVGRDPSTDLAVVDIASDASLKPVSWGDSEALQQGDVVLAIGTPRELQLKQTVTMGIVSATGREIGGLRYEDFIQTDASINSGNSGGPLINVKGEVVGVNQSIVLGDITSSDGSSAQGPSGDRLRVNGNIGLGMAIPASLARKIADELIQHQRVRRGYLGVKLEEVSDETGGSTFSSLQVTDLLPDSPAAQAGVKPGDDLLMFNNRAVSSMRAFHLQVSLTEPGTKAALSVLRKGEPVTLNVVLGDLAKTRYAAIGFDPTTREFPDLEGVELQQIRHPVLGQGIVIARLDASSPAARAGVRAPALIIAVAGVEVSSAEEFKSAVQTTVQGGYLLLTVKEIRPRGMGNQMDVSIPVGPRKP